MTGATRTWTAALLGASCGLALGAGCGEIVRPQVVVRILAGADDAARVRWLRVRVFDEAGEARRDDTVERDPSANGDVVQVAQIPLVPEDFDPTRRWRLEVDAFEGEARPAEDAVGFAQVRAEGGYVADRVVTLRLRLDPSCGPCPEGQTCVDGVCVGACFDVAAARPETPRCGECERCAVGECEPRTGEPCGCPGETCAGDGTCDVEEPFSGVSAGLDATCARGRAGRVLCWGNNADGALGVDGVSGSDVPLLVEGLPRARGLDLGGFEVVGNTTHACVRGEGGQLACWGRNQSGRLGPDIGAVLPPGELALAFGAQQVRLGGLHTCVTDLAGQLFCMGRDAEGQLGRGEAGAQSTELAAVAGERRWRDFDLGYTNSCAISFAREVYCWGDNRTGQLGLAGDLTRRREPTRVDVGELDDFVSIALGAFHGCALRADGEAWCWGGAAFGNLGRPEVTGEAPPAPVSLDEPLSRLDCGRSHCCGVTLAGDLYCWGRNQRGAVGVGRESDAEPLPLPVGTTRTWEEFDGGEWHSCAVTTRGALYCWGDNAHGQLGVGDRERRLVPTRVCPPR